jgi:phenylacetate-CoA ligase
MDIIKFIGPMSAGFRLRYFITSLILRCYRRGIIYHYYTNLFRNIDQDKREKLLIDYVNNCLKELNTNLRISEQTIFADLNVSYSDALGKDRLRKILSKHSTINILLRSNTSGSTGMPMTMHFRRKDLQKTYAIWDHYLWLNGVDKNARRARFSGRLGKRDPLFIELPLLNTRLYNSYRVENNELTEILDSLSDWNPELIEGYPSMISTLGKFLLKSKDDFSFRSLKMISTTAETLFDWDRSIIERAFKVKVYNQYASSEGSPFIAECAYGRLHLYLYSGLIRKVVDQDIYLVTSFRSSKFHLVNYDIGDKFILEEQDHVIGSKCRCGSIHPVITDILGRKDDFILDENKNPIQRLDIIYKGLYGILESQIVQYQEGSVTIFIKPDSTWDDKARDKIITNTKNLLGEKMNVIVKLKTSIEKGPNGKFRAVLNNLN